MDSSAKYENGLCFHGHQLQLVHTPGAKSFTCKGCKERGSGHRYRCSKTCDFTLHRECFQPPLTLQHPHFPGHTFHFLLQPPTETPRRFCDACGKPVLCYVYHCREGGWDLHPCCSTLPRNIQLFSGGPELSLREDTIGDDRGLLVGSGNTKACFRCKNATLQGTNKGVPGWSYVSACGVDRCHVYCTMKWLREITARLADRRPRGRANTNTDESWWETLTLSLLSTTTEFMLGDPTGIIAGVLFLGDDV